MFLVCMSVNAHAQQANRPITNKIKQVDNYHGTSIEDPYRWLEDDNSEATKNWVREQNKFTQQYMSQIPYRDKIRDRMKELVNYTRYSIPVLAGDYIIYSKNDGLQNQAIYYKKLVKTGETSILIDPNKMSPDGTISVSVVAYSKDKKYLNYLISKSGSDWSEMRIIDISSGIELNDKIEWLKFTGASWWKDGFFYSRYPQPDAGKELTIKSENHAVYYHNIGDEQKNDLLIFEDKENPLRTHSLSISEDGLFAYLSVSKGTDGSDTYFSPINSLNNLNFKPLITGFDHRSRVIDNEGDNILVLTDIDAPNYRLVKIDSKNPHRDRWKDIIPASNNLLESVSAAGGKLFTKYLKDVVNYIYVYDRTGKILKEVAMPTLGSISGLGGEKDSEKIYFQLNSHIAPPTVYEYNIKTDKYQIFFKSKNNDDRMEVISEQVFFKSKDGTKIPMFLIYKKGLKKDGERPVILYGYGGFNISLTPNYDAFTRVIAENDGIYAIVNLRGGGEYGEDWHKAGMKENKQNVFDDFIAAAEFLIKENYTKPEKLGIYGRSNGGLLVGACMTQRPDLFKVAFPTVGVLDMLRFHKFTIGWAWVGEYGSSDNSEDFKYLIKYSPLHNIKKNEYPATLVLTSDHDDRVVPSHSFKFAATLQEKQQGDNPVLIRIETQAGHGAGVSLSKSIETFADMYAYFFYKTNSTIK